MRFDEVENLEFNIEENANTGYKNQAIIESRLDYYQYNDIGRFICPSISNTRKNHTCKECKRKITDEQQIITTEPYYPAYHVKCYLYMFDILMDKIKQNKSIIMSHITDLDNTETSSILQERIHNEKQ